MESSIELNQSLRAIKSFVNLHIVTFQIPTTRINRNLLKEDKMEKKKTSDQILPETRLVAIFVIPFLVVAFGILYILPFETEKLFAWKIQPTMSAMMLGAAYAGGIYFFIGVVRSKYWHKIKVGFLPVISFASMLGIATILHWDRFNHNHISFIAWAGLYFTTPFILFFVWLRNKTQDSGLVDNQEILIPSLVRSIIGAIGGVTLIISLFLFIEPSIMIAQWPWALTPLTSRVMGAMFALPGFVGLGIALDARWSSAKIILQSQSFSILFILLAAIRAQNEFDWTQIASWLFVGGLGIMLAGIIMFYINMQGKQKKIR